jgi:hypothetical protein
MHVILKSYQYGLTIVQTDEPSKEGRIIRLNEPDLFSTYRVTWAARAR